MALGAAVLCAAAQVQTPPATPPASGQAAEKPVEPPAERPILQNHGRPMALEYRCNEEEIRSTGLSCTREDPCPLYLELTSVEAAGNRIFLVGNIHSPSTTLSSVLLASDDGGKTWREPHERLRAAGLDHIQFIDFQNGWISGALLHPLPHDPFLLTTSDGGQLWRVQAIFAEPRFGFIQQFWFSSRTNGSIVMDQGQAGESGRYELYETPNAGDTWVLRQTSERPLQIKRASGTTDWRLRADAATKSYRIERHAADAWHGIASFAVSIGGCTPPEPPAVPSEANAPGISGSGR